MELRQRFGFRNYTRKKFGIVIFLFMMLKTLLQSKLRSNQKQPLLCRKFLYHSLKSETSNPSHLLLSSTHPFSFQKKITFLSYLYLPYNYSLFDFALHSPTELLISLKFVLLNYSSFVFDVLWGRLFYNIHNLQKTLLQFESRGASAIKLLLFVLQ